MARRVLFDLVHRNTTRTADAVRSEAFAVRVLRAALPFMGVPKDKVAEVAVTVIGERRMRTLNRRWRKVDKPTDVLAFPLFPQTPKGYTHISLGDVFVCPEVVREKAAAAGNSFRYQMQWSLAHGFLHLAGYDHERSAAQARRMADAERRILRDLN